MNTVNYAVKNNTFQQLEIGSCHLNSTGCKQPHEVWNTPQGIHLKKQQLMITLNHTGSCDEFLVEVGRFYVTK